MVKLTSNSLPTKKFGVRYGRTTKEKYAKMENLQKKEYKCPYCSYPKVTRISVGIWTCLKCGAKFTGRAYTIEKTVPVEEVKAEVPAEAGEQ